MIGHHHIGVKLVLLQFPFAGMKCIHDNLRDLGPPQPGWSVLSSVEIAVDPDERLASREAIRWNIATGRQTVVDTPGEKQVLPFRVPVGEAALMEAHPGASGVCGAKFSEPA